MLLVVATTGMSGACSESWGESDDDDCWYVADATDVWVPLTIETGGVARVEGDGVDCGEHCQVDRSCSGHELRAESSRSSPLLGWSGDCLPRDDGACDVTGSDSPRGDGYVVATFGPSYADWSRSIPEVPKTTQAAVRSSDTLIAATGYSDDEGWQFVPCNIYRLDDEGTVLWQQNCGAETVAKVSLAPTATGVVFAAKTTGPLTLDEFTSTYRGMVVADVAVDGDATRFEEFRATKLRLGNVASGAHTSFIATVGAAIEYRDVRYELPPSGQSQILLARRTNGSPDGAFDVDVFGSAADDNALAVAIDTLGRDWIVVQLGGPYATAAGTVGPGPALLVLQGVDVVLAMPLGDESGYLNGGPALLQPTEDGGMIVGLSFAGRLRLGGVSYRTPATGAWVGRVSAAGDVRWGHAWQTNRVPALSSLAVQDDRVFLTGTFYGAIDVDRRSIAATDLGSNLLASFDASTGAVRWLQRVGNLPSWTSPDAGLLLVATPTTLFGLGSGPTGWGGLRETSGLADGTSLIRYVDGAP